MAAVMRPLSGRAGLTIDNPGPRQEARDAGGVEASSKAGQRHETALSIQVNTSTGPKSTEIVLPLLPCGTAG